MKNTYFKNPDIIEKGSEATLLLFNVTNGKMVELNETAKLLWEKTGAMFAIEDLEKLITEGCDGVQNLETDLVAFIKSGMQANVIAEQPYEKD
jgi:hypothetical protein